MQEIDFHIIRGSRVWAVVRASASHQCGPGSIPRPGVLCGLSLLLVLYSAPGEFFSEYSGFPLSLQNTKLNIFSKFQFNPGKYRHFWTSSCELLAAPWVNKLHYFTFTFTHECVHIQCTQHIHVVEKWWLFLNSVVCEAGFWHFPKNCFQIPYPRAKAIDQNLALCPCIR